MTSNATVEAECAEGRYWRAREILAGRLSSSDYDPELFRRFADVLYTMGDDDEAGRYYLLAGQRGRSPDNTAQALAQHFLKRRRGTPIEQIWASMPRAAHRLTDATLAAPLADALEQAGYDADAVSTLIDTAVEKHRQRRLRGLRPFIPHSITSETAGIGLAIAIFLIFLLGILKLAEIAGNILSYL